MVDTTARQGSAEGGAYGFGAPGTRRRGSWLWDRQLDHYPDERTRSRYLGITVLATIVLYYELYVGGSVATKVIAQYGFTFTEFIMVLVVGNAVGACASLFAGLADRWGRANLVVGGLLLTGLLTAIGIPHAPNKLTYAIMIGLVSIVEGMVLVATPALIRDFSPQVGRGAAMGFWTLGPVLGSLVVTVISSHTLNSHPNWRFQFYVCGVVGLVVFALALFGLRELSPALRDQLMVSLKDRQLIEARAAGLDPDKALQGSWRQMLRFDIVGSAFAVAVFLLLYYVLVAFLVVYFVTAFGYSEQRANSLANWYWIANAISLVVTGLLSDKLRVRKPLMLVGAAIGLVGTGAFAIAAGKSDTSYYTFAILFVVGAFGGGMAYVSWMAGFTETVEKHNPAATATGLAIWGWIVRVVVTVSYAALILVVPATSTLVDKGPRAQEIAAAHPEAVKVLGSLDPATAAALSANPNDPVALPKALGEVAGVQGGNPAAVQAAAARRMPQIVTANAIEPATLAKLSANDLSVAPAAIQQISSKLKINAADATTRLTALAGPGVKEDLALIQPYGAALTSANTSIPPADLKYLSDNGAKVTKAQKDNPKQWQHWWWVCLVAQAVFIPFIFVLSGRWSPRKARQDERDHEQLVQRELEALQAH